MFLASAYKVLVLSNGPCPQPLTIKVGRIISGMRVDLLNRGSVRNEAEPELTTWTPMTIGSWLPAHLSWHQWQDWSYGMRGAS